MIVVRLPAALRGNGPDTLVVDEPITTMADLIDVLCARVAGFRDQLDDAMLNFAVNDEMLLSEGRDRRLADRDTVEIVPTLSGG